MQEKLENIYTVPSSNEKLRVMMTFYWAAAEEELALLTALC